MAQGLPSPVRQFQLAPDIRVDLAWPRWRIAVEFQSYRHHFGRHTWRRDAARFNRVAADGWLVFAATEEDVADRCCTLAADIARATAA